MVKNYILAKDAKQLTETSEKLLNNVFKNVKEAANYGRYITYFDVFDVSEVVVDKLTSTLQEAGYTVEPMTEDDGKLVGLTITW